MFSDNAEALTDDSTEQMKIEFDQQVEQIQSQASAALSGSYFMLNQLYENLLSDTLPLMTKTLTMLALLSLGLEVCILLSPDSLKRILLTIDSFGCLISSSISMMIWICCLIWAVMTKWQ
jgi:hypothetical protein